MKIDKIHKIAIKAGIEASQIVWEIFNKRNFITKLKEDNSLVTTADLESSRIITEILHETKIPVLSEEDDSNKYIQRKNWKSLWIVDPLDGTKGFVKGDNEFTINIGLVKNGMPVFGVIVVPSSNEVYFGGKDFGSFKFNFNSEPFSTATKLPLFQTPANELIITGGSETNSSFYIDFPFLTKKYKLIKFIKVASALKFCLVAEGKIDVYPRNYPCMEWDTAAGHAIINGIGKELYDVKSEEVITYNREDLYVPFFVLT